MLKEFRLWNFKAFKDTGKIELAKLNVFVGANSSGKSSLLPKPLAS